MIWHSSTAAEILSHFKVDDKKGLANSECEEKLEIYGKNVISNIEKPTFLSYFLNQLKSKMVIFLIAVALISFVLSIIYNDVNSISALLIIGIVVLNALISAYYQYNCYVTLDSIKNYTNPAVSVLRDGVIKSINAADLVTGDIIILEEGDYVPADARIIECNEFRCNEFNLTGVEVPVEKNGDGVLDDITPLEDRLNMIFSSCSVVHGTAKAVVVATGLNTEIGKTSAILQQTGNEKLPLQSNLDNMGKIANAVILAVCGIVFLISIIQNFATDNFAHMTMKMLLNSVALALAAIPEGLPTIAAVVIALGIKRILKDGIIIKNTDSVEILGRTDILCCDKTGILTRNKMNVTKIFDGDKLCSFAEDTPDEKIMWVLKLATACSTLQNDSTEYAIEKACLTYNSMSLEDIGNVFPKISYVSFDSERKSMSVITMLNNRPLAIIKGAPEAIVSKCINCDNEKILKLNETLAEEGLRIVCIAIKELNELPANPVAEEIESDLIFVGLVALEDPAREGVEEDITACISAGITPVMITGDNIKTAITIAKRIGIMGEGTLAITGDELAQMSDEELSENIEKYSVFARITPAQKSKIVKAWQAKGKIVTVTGDGLEDAEALGLSDVGCAIGKFGADVTKGNADIIISNNRFHSILKTIRESKGMFSNIRKSVMYLFGCNIAEMLAVLFGLIIFRSLPIAAVQLLWINLLTDSLPAISLSLEKAEKGVMKYDSILFNRVFNFKSAILIAVQSMFIAAATLIAFMLGNDFGDTATASTFAFTVLGLSQIFHCFNCKFEGNIRFKKLFSNNFMNFSAFISIFITIFLVVTPSGALFGLGQLNFLQLLICLCLSLVIIPITEVTKLIIGKF